MIKGQKEFENENERGEIESDVLLSSKTTEKKRHRSVLDIRSVSSPIAAATYAFETSYYRLPKETRYSLANGTTCSSRDAKELLSPTIAPMRTCKQSFELPFSHLLSLFLFLSLCGEHNAEESAESSSQTSAQPTYCIMSKREVA